MGRTLTSF
ncbi:unnamed protein product, partial [Didymodactylos carnosus]